MIIYIITIITISYFYYKINIEKQKRNIKKFKQYNKDINQYLIKSDQIKYINQNSIRLNQNILTNYDYFINNCDLCPMGSYKQCSNNYSYKNYPPQIKCNAYNITQDLCNEKYSQKFLVTNNICNSRDKKKNIIKYPNNNPRVNIWNSS